MKNLILGLILTVVSISGLTGFVNTATAAETTTSVVNTVSQYRYEYKRLNSQWVLRMTYRESDNRLVDIDIIHEDN
ncbi:MAG TPA: hypothetical protein VHP32_10210 [Ignavibacteria bacterium]|nr:hypothetical protein [Ignavibacteria bacterium]